MDTSIKVKVAIREKRHEERSQTTQRHNTSPINDKYKTNNSS